MKIVELGSAVEIQDVDLFDDAQCEEIGRMVADRLVVLIDQAVSEQRFYDIHRLWGQPMLGPMYHFVDQGRLTGPHWRRYTLATSQITTSLEDPKSKPGMTRVSFTRDKKGKPTGIFTNGTLNWHCDHQALVMNQRVVSLMSLYGSEGSQTSFLTTDRAYEALNAEDRSMVDELTVVCKWCGTVSEGLTEEQQDITHYFFCPLDGMESPLVNETNTGRRGLKFPSVAFSHFKGMSREESLKYRAHLWSQLNRPENIYTQNWRDGQIVIMDQNITLHARPTNVDASSQRTMSRMACYLDRLYPGRGPLDYVFYDSRRISMDEFAELIDAQRRREHEAARAERRAAREGQSVWSWTHKL